MDSKDLFIAASSGLHSFSNSDPSQHHRLSPCLTASESVKVRDGLESHKGLPLQEGRAEDPAQTIHQPFLHSLLLRRAVPQGRFLSPELKMYLKADAAPFLIQY